MTDADHIDAAAARLAAGIEKGLREAARLNNRARAIRDAVFADSAAKVEGQDDNWIMDLLTGDADDDVDPRHADAQGLDDRADRILGLVRKLTDQLRPYGKCSRCAGTGHLPYYQHVQNGECFACGGSGQNAIGVRYEHLLTA
jgi:hypothetical protein